ncbi:GNAT family N-acetyltransferase [Candidatus Micrarchaeota archaeon]|nr:GNAT family N-acetyltransferase [Candidatus Micrarchaeota archaeon]
MVSYRDMKKEDEGEVKNLILEVFEEYGYKPTKNDYDISGVYSFYTENGGKAVLVLSKNKIIGVIAVSGKGLIKRFYIKKEFRNIGIGYNIFHIITRFCRENKINKLTAEVPESLKLGLEFYRDNEFKITEKKNGILYMEKII